MVGRLPEERLAHGLAAQTGEGQGQGGKHQAARAQPPDAAGREERDRDEERPEERSEVKGILDRDPQAEGRGQRHERPVGRTLRQIRGRRVPAVGLGGDVRPHEASPARKNCWPGSDSRSRMPARLSPDYAEP